MTLFIAHRSQTVRASIINVFAHRAGVEIVGTARSVSEALNGISRLRPDVMLLDVQLCRNCSVDLIRLLKVGRPGLQVVLLAEPPIPSAQQERRGGAAEADLFFDKSLGLERLTEVITSISCAT
jgi:DNA-binding NarL/FixJ family response regulator